MLSKSVRVWDPWRQSKWNQKDCGETYLWNRWVLSLELKAEGVIDCESEVRWCVQDELNRESEQDEVELDGTKEEANSRGKVINI